MPVHVHLNLLGWATMMLFGLYYRGDRGLRAATAPRRMAFLVAVVGMILFAFGLAVVSLGNEGMEPVLDRRLDLSADLDADLRLGGLAGGNDAAPRLSTSSSSRLTRTARPGPCRWRRSCASLRAARAWPGGGGSLRPSSSRPWYGDRPVAAQAVELAACRPHRRRAPPPGWRRTGTGNEAVLRRERLHVVEGIFRIGAASFDEMATKPMPSSASAARIRHHAVGDTPSRTGSGCR